MWLAKKYCIGDGIELGAAAHNSFGLTSCMNVAPSDGVSFIHPRDLEDYQQYYREQERGVGSVAKVDMLGDFQSIHAADASVDYIISSHVIEHVPDLFAAYLESFRVLKNAGVFFCIFPKRIAAPTDRTRSLNTLDKMIEDHRCHLTVLTAPIDEWRGHYQVLSLQSMIRSINYLNKCGMGSWYIECIEETDTKVGNGHTVVLRKWEGLSALLPLDTDDFNAKFNSLLQNGKLGEALSLVKACLSFDFFDSKKLYLASALSRLLGSHHEGNEYLQQSLIVDPENEEYRKEFLELFGRPYINPVL